MVAPDPSASPKPPSFFSRLRGLLGRRNSVAPKPWEPPPLRLLCGDCKEILAFELEVGATPEVDERVDALRRHVATATPTYYNNQADDEAIDDLWVYFARLGMFDEFLDLVDRCKLPLRPGLREFLEFCKDAYAQSQARGEAYREARPGREIVTLGCVVWGKVYVDNFLRMNLRSMMSKGNIPGLAEQFATVLNIVTDEAGRRQIEAHPVFAEVAAIADVEFTVIPEAIIPMLYQGHVIRNFYVLFGMLEHCAVYFAQAAGSHLFMIPVDAVVADGSLVNMAAIRDEGYECCGGGNIVANTETFLPALEDWFGDGPISISTRELASLAVKHAHHYFQSQIMAAENQDFGKHPRELFWPVEGGVEIHSVFIHPLFTTASALARYKRKHFANIDYGMIPRMFVTSEKIRILEKAERAYVNNFTARDRRYETTGRPFTVSDFYQCHDNTYPVQKSLFPRGQFLPCTLEGWTAYSDVRKDVAEIAEALIGPTPAAGTTESAT